MTIYFRERINTHQKRLLHLIFIAILSCWQSGCGPEQGFQAPSVSQHIALDSISALKQLGDIEKSLAASDSARALQLINTFQAALPTSFPMNIAKPFFPHSFQDQLMKDTRIIQKGHFSKVGESWQKLLEALEGHLFYHDNIKIAIDTKIARSVLKGIDPVLTTEFFDDFTTVTSTQLQEINDISIESFWAPAFLYVSDPGISKQQGTGLVLVKNETKIVGVLEFQNHLISKKTINLGSINDLAYVVPKTPGYVGSVGRLASYARFGIGNKMFAEFFQYAITHGIEESYLHVRNDNPSAINLYQSLGYQIVADIPNYYPDPPADAHVMWKKF
jgi:ribosomal protein S18 acetylase RimI-like enzyme